MERGRGTGEPTACSIVLRFPLVGKICHRLYSSFDDHDEGPASPGWQLCQQRTMSSHYCQRQGRRRPRIGSGSVLQQPSKVTTKPQQLTGQSPLEPFRLLVTQLVCSCRHARQPTLCEEGTRSVSHVFVGGRCGGAAPAQGRPLAADRPKYNNEGRRNTFARLIQGCESVAAE